MLLCQGNRLTVPHNHLAYLNAVVRRQQNKPVGPNCPQNDAWPPSVDAIFLNDFNAKLIALSVNQSFYEQFIGDGENAECGGKG